MDFGEFGGKGKKGKKGGKKAKAEKVNLNAFLAAGPTVPTAPPQSNSSYDDQSRDRGRRSYDEGPKVFDRSMLPTGPRASQGPENIDLSALPPTGPYTVFLGNLAYETQEEDISQFFEMNNVKCSQVRIPRSQDSDRIKGFGYAEFDTIDDLKGALALSNENILSRRVRIDLADQGAGRDEGGDRGGRGRLGDREYASSRADEDSMWRRPANDPGLSGPPPSSGFDRGGDRYGDRGGDRYGDRGGDRYDRPRHVSRADEDASWSRGEAPPPSREDRFSSRGGFDRDGPRGGGYDRDGPRDGGYGRGRGGFDRDGPRSGGYDRDGPRGGGYDRDGPRGGDRYGSDRGGGGSWERGAAMPDPPPREERPLRDERGDRFSRGGRGRDEPETWGRGEALPPAPEPREPAVPPSRPKLNLARRSAPASAAGEPTGDASIFGGAKPVDTASKLNEVDAKLGEGKKYAAAKSTGHHQSSDVDSSAAVRPSTNAAPAAKSEEEGPPAPTNAFAGLAVEDDDEN